eukprot:2897266-Lingulodinium_polyedra.AAC.1
MDAAAGAAGKHPELGMLPTIGMPAARSDAKPMSPWLARAISVFSSRSDFPALIRFGPSCMA